MTLLKSILKFIAYWLIVFFIQRSIFFVFHYDKIKQGTSIELIQVFINGGRLDLAMIGYFLLVPLILILFSFARVERNPLYQKIVYYYNWVLTIIVVILGVIDLSIYTEWGTKVNSRAIEFFLSSPGEALASSASSPVLGSIIIVVSQLILYLFLLKKVFTFEYPDNRFKYKKLIYFPIVFICSVIMLRGGLQLAPINQSSVYFSNITSINHTSLNTVWNLMHSFIENHFSTDNPYLYMDKDEAKSIVDSLYEYDRSKSVSILKNKRPNIVIVILESFTSDVVGSFGGDKKVSPYLSKIADEGLSFKNIYSSGDRTDKGLISILSAFPSQAGRSIIQLPEKYEKLNSLPRTLINNGYDAAFYYGGESEFANMKSYLLSTGINNIVDKKNFKESEMNSKWGAHDGYLFEKVLSEIPKQKEPFLSVVLTISSHEPFEVPIPSQFKDEDLPAKFKRAANYTDICINEFITKAKKEAWYDNTLFIFVADHGHRLPRRYKQAYDYRKFRIPLILYGNVIIDEYQATSLNTIGSQTDIASTLLQQLNINDSSYTWSKDLLNTSASQFAFYSYDNGIGWVDTAQIYSMDNVNKIITTKKNKKDKKFKKRLVLGKAYMQEVFTEYLSY